jgi:Translation initiation factor 1 (eIF-1/SUI1) and related proteins
MQPLLGDLFRSRGLAAAGKEEPEPGRNSVPEGPSLPGPDLSGVSRIVLQFEKKGHGGKRATRVEGLPFGTEALNSLARELRREMGCGAWVEGGTLLLQGDLTERLRDWFEAKGAKRVVISGRGGSAG